jgi:uncharacterized RDD family membrane protein YckC
MSTDQSDLPGTHGRFLHQKKPETGTSNLPTQLQAGFWRRLAAMWVDAFVVYAAASAVLTLTDTIGLRLAFEPLFLVAGAGYSGAMLARQHQTIGKILLRIAVVTRAGNELTIGSILLREVVGKWFLAAAAPCVLGRVIAGPAWVPTVYDLLVLAPIWGFLLVWHLIAGRPFYDQIAGTTVVRASGVGAWTKPAVIALAGAAVLLLCARSAEFLTLHRLPCRLTLYRSMRSPKPYVAFLSRGPARPVDYVLGLFDRYDVVVLCERDHREGTQWDFIFNVLSDPRFAARVGHVFTELGNRGLQAYLDEFMATDGLSPDEIHKRAVHIMRNWSPWPLWPRTNFYLYLKRLYGLNQSLPRERRIRHHMTDVAIDWEGVTPEGFRAFQQSLANRDERMAQCVIDEMRALDKARGAPQKCLVVMNYRHAFDLTGRSPRADRRNTFEYLKEAFGARAANVLLNWSILYAAPMAGGLWDAAFEKVGHRPAGFDFAHSPFGEDPFDLFPFLPNVRARLKYRDVFTGFAFTHPMKDQFTEEGIPGYFDDFEAQMRRRAEFFGVEFRSEVERIMKDNRVPTKTEVPARQIETAVELVLGGVAAAGLLIGLAAGGLAFAARGKSLAAD